MSCILPGFTLPLVLVAASLLQTSCKSTGTAENSSDLAARAPARRINIVTIGDSYAAGEGNPVKYAHGLWNSTAIPLQKAVWSNKESEVPDALRCHRSDYSGHHLAYKRIKGLIAEKGFKSDYKNFACSGARIDTGLLGPYYGAEPDPNTIGRNPDGGTWLKPQIQQVDEYYQANKPGEDIDILLISIGGNDFNFAEIIRDCVGPSADGCSKSEKTTSIFKANSKIRAAVKAKFQDLMTVIAGDQPLSPNVSYSVLNSRNEKVEIKNVYREMKTKVKHIIIVGYPLPVVGWDGHQKKLCDLFIGERGDLLDVFDPKFLGHDFAENILKDESAFIQDTALPTINGAVDTFAASAPAGMKVSVVRGMTESFKGHGICSLRAQRWINTNMDAEEKQGKAIGIEWSPELPPPPFIAFGASSGFVHPNMNGYRNMAEEILKVMEGVVIERIAADNREIAKWKAKEAAKEAARARAEEARRQRLAELYAKIPKVNTPEDVKIIVQAVDAEVAQDQATEDEE